MFVAKVKPVFGRWNGKKWYCQCHDVPDRPYRSKIGNHAIETPECLRCGDVRPYPIGQAPKIVDQFTIKSGMVLMWEEHGMERRGVVIPDRLYAGGFRIGERSIGQIMEACSGIVQEAPLVSRSKVKKTVV